MWASKYPKFFGHTDNLQTSKFQTAVNLINPPIESILFYPLDHMDHIFLIISSNWPNEKIIFLSNVHVLAHCVMCVCLSWFCHRVNISAKENTKMRKFSGYDPWGLLMSSKTSCPWMTLTLSSMSPVRHPQCCPSKTPLDPPPFFSHF